MTARSRYPRPWVSFLVFRRRGQSPWHSRHVHVIWQRGRGEFYG